MEWEETLKILSSYKFQFNRSEQMLEKIHMLEIRIYDAQAGFVENKEGVKVSGGNHIKRDENIAVLTDLKDAWSQDFKKAESCCKNIAYLIERIYTNNSSLIDPLTHGCTDNRYTNKLQKYESILISYYVNNKSIRQIADKMCYDVRQTQRILNDARRTFYNMYKHNTFETMQKFLYNEIFENQIIVAQNVI